MRNASPSSGARLGTAMHGSNRYALHVFWVIFAISFLNFVDRNILTGAANTVAHELELGIDSIGFIVSAFLIVYTLCVISMGVWTDRVKRKNVVALSVAVWSVATALTALSFTFLSCMVWALARPITTPGTALLCDYFSHEKCSCIMS